MMTLVALAITVAYAYSAVVVLGLPGTVFFWETATLIDIMLLGHWIEMRSVLGASRALEQLVRLLPAVAHRVRSDGSVEDMPLDALRSGDRVLIKPGETVPTDGLVVQGRTSVNQAMLTGESQPVEKGEGDDLIGGAVNGEGAITIDVQRTGAETYLSQVMELVRKAQETRSRTQDLANRAALWLTCCGSRRPWRVALSTRSPRESFARPRSVACRIRPPRTSRPSQGTALGARWMARTLGS